MPFTRHVPQTSCMSFMRSCGVGIKSSRCQEVDILAVRTQSAYMYRNKSHHSRLRHGKTEALVKEKPLRVATERQTVFSP
jgi:hypothetical protein